MHISEVIRGWLGWCPHAFYRKSRVAPAPGHEALTRIPDPVGPQDPAPIVTAPTEHRPEYQTNLLLILLLLGGLYYASNRDFILPFNILSAVLVYFDAENIHAGNKFDEVKLLGEVATWRPIVWAVAVFIVPFILLLLYICCRREVYNANN